MATTKKTDTDKPTLSAADQITYVAPAAEFPFVYANNALMTFSDVDGSIIFGEVVGKDDESGKTMVIPKVKVVMANAFVRKLRDLLVANIETHERKTKD